MGFKFYFPLIMFLLLSALAAFIGMIKYGNTYEARKAKKKRVTAVTRLIGYATLSEIS